MSDPVEMTTDVPWTCPGCGQDGSVNTTAITGCWLDIGAPGHLIWGTNDSHLHLHNLIILSRHSVNGRRVQWYLSHRHYLNRTWWNHRIRTWWNARST